MGHVGKSVDNVALEFDALRNAVIDVPNMAQELADKLAEMGMENRALADAAAALGAIAASAVDGC